MGILPKFSLQLTFSQDHRADDGHQEQDRSDLKGQQVIGKQAAGNGFGVAQARYDFPARRQAGLAVGVNHDQGGEAGQDRGQKLLADMGNYRGLLGLPQIQEHDDEQEQHHDGPGVNDHLDGGDELGMGQQVDAGYRKEVDDEPEGASQGVALKDHQAAGDQGHCGQDEKQNLHPPGLLYSQSCSRKLDSG